MLLREYISYKKRKYTLFYVDYIQKHYENKEGYPFELSLDKWEKLMSVYDRANSRVEKSDKK